MIAQQAPCYEASFAMDNRSAFKMYESLVPRVKELALRCGRCRELREQAGIKDPPVSHWHFDDVQSYWHGKELEADVNNLAT